MNLSRFSVSRPIFTIMVTLIVIILGGVSLLRLPVDLMPDITYPTLSVATSYENASPEEIEELITRPMEQAMAAVPGVEEVSSVSVEGSSRVRISFAWGTDLDAAANDIRDRLDRVVRALPDDADRPTLRKFDLAGFPILIMGVSSKLDPIELRRVIDDQVKYRIERVPGVAALNVWGGLDREIHVDIDAAKVKALGLSLDQIIGRVRSGNVNVPAGTVERGNYNVTLRTPGEFTSLDELRATVVAVRQGVDILLGEIANVEDTWRKVTRIVRVNGEPGIRLSINKQSGMNTVEVARRALEEIERVNEDIKQIRIVPIIDTSDYIQRSIGNVGTMALYGAILAVFVLLFFLRSLRSTAIIATAIPTSIIATFALLYFGGLTLNIMTLGGLALGVGMLLDNAIVVLENIYRLREGGTEPRLAAVVGSNEVTAAIIASTLTTLAVFLPMIFVRGMSGVMFKQLAYVVGFALLCSLGVALTVVPMLAARGRRHSAEGGPQARTLWARVYERTGAAFKEMEAAYKSTLHFALDHRILVTLGALALLGGSLALIPLVGVEFMPASDEGEVRVNAEMDVGTRLEIVDEKFKEIERIVAEEVGEIENVVTSVGGGGWRASGGHTGSMRISLVPQRERSRSSEEVAEALRKPLSALPGVTVRTRAGQGLFLLRMGSGGTERVQIEIRGYDQDIADALAQRIKETIEPIQGITDVSLSRESGAPEERIQVDRVKASDMKLTVSEVAEMLQTVLSGKRAGYFRQGGNEYPIVVKVREAEKLDLREILDLTLTNADGDQVVLRNVVTTTSQRGPIRIDRKDQERVVTVSANITGRDTGSILSDIRQAFESLPVPRGFSIVYGGDYEEQQKAFHELLISIILALILVYMVMACQFESLRDPFVVMFAVPFATVGVVLMLFLSDTTFNVQSYIGCIMLGGIVVNNAILLVDHTNLLRRRDGLALREAIEEAGRRRLRPILMTASTTVLGLTPLAIGLGEGGEAQAPLARAVIGGLLSSTLITLVFVPVVYSVFERGLKSRKAV
ncbi:MAG: efflux RND transporter permease subunit [Planctomycetota bacterium]|jgi:HAE1 family hydrophobic/amphiphilic exporter-1